MGFKNRKFAIRAIPGDLGFIFEVFLGKAYEIDGEFVPKEGDTCLDIGAHMGSCTLSWLSHNATGRIICCEPNPGIYQRLLKNVQLNAVRNISALPMALSSRDAAIEMFIDEYATMAVIGATRKNTRIVVEAVTLDSLMTKMSLERVDLCKIDVEGHEVEVFKGAQGSLPKIERLIVEYHSRELKQQVKEFLQKDFDVVRETGDVSGLIFARNLDRAGTRRRE